MLSNLCAKIINFQGVSCRMRESWQLLSHCVIQWLLYLEAMVMISFKSSTVGVLSSNGLPYWTITKPLYPHQLQLIHLESIVKNFCVHLSFKYHNCFLPNFDSTHLCNKIRLICKKSRPQNQFRYSMNILCKNEKKIKVHFLFICFRKYMYGIWAP